MTYQDQNQQQGQPQSADLWFGLWTKTGNNGGSYLSGSVEIAGQKFWMKVLKKTNKQKPEQPDYNLVLTPATPQQQAPQQGYQQAPQQNYQQPQQGYQQAPVQQQYQQAPQQQYQQPMPQNYAPAPQGPVDTSQLPF